MKALLAAALVVALAGPDYEKMLAEAKYSLAEAVDKGLKEAKEGVVLKVQLERERGKVIYTMDIAQGDKILEINLDVKDGSVVERKTENDDKSKVAKAAKVGLKQAIEASLKKSEGKAVSAEIRLKAGKPEVEVRVYKEGKLTGVTVDGEKGEVTGSKEIKPGPKKPGIMGIQGEAVEGGVRISSLIKDFPAEKAGLKRDDIVTAVNGKKVKDVDELRGILAEAGEGSKVKVEYKRGETVAEVSVTLAAAPDEDEEEEEEEEDK
jgi:uncharacterized membrane protein YkoI